MCVIVDIQTIVSVQVVVYEIKSKEKVPKHPEEDTVPLWPEADKTYTNKWVR